MITKKPAYGRLTCYECGRVITWKSVREGTAHLEVKLDFQGDEYDWHFCAKCNSKD